MIENCNESSAIIIVCNKMIIMCTCVISSGVIYPSTIVTFYIPSGISPT